MYRGKSFCKRQRVDANSIGINQWIGTNVNRLHLLLETSKSRYDILFSPYFRSCDLNSQRLSYGLHLIHLQDRGGVAGIANDSQAVQLGEHLAQKSEQLACHVGPLNREPCYVTTWSRKTCHQSFAERVAGYRKDDRNFRSCFF